MRGGLGLGKGSARLRSQALQASHGACANAGPCSPPPHACMVHTVACMVHTVACMHACARPILWHQPRPPTHIAPACSRSQILSLTPLPSAVVLHPEARTSKASPVPQAPPPVRRLPLPQRGRPPLRAAVACAAQPRFPLLLLPLLLCCCRCPLAARALHCRLLLLRRPPQGGGASPGCWRCCAATLPGRPPAELGVRTVRLGRHRAIAGASGRGQPGSVRRRGQCDNWCTTGGSLAGRPNPPDGRPSAPSGTRPAPERSDWGRSWPPSLLLQGLSTNERSCAYTALLSGTYTPKMWRQRPPGAGRAQGERRLPVLRGLGKPRTWKPSSPRETRTWCGEGCPRACAWGRGAGGAASLGCSRHRRPGLFDRSGVSTPPASASASCRIRNYRHV